MLGSSWFMVHAHYSSDSCANLTSIVLPSSVGLVLMIFITELSPFGCTSCHLIGAGGEQRVGCE